MNVASLELCKELYELSGWDDTEKMWADGKYLIVGDVDRCTLGYNEPAYDLGYLLRKLPENVDTGDVIDHNRVLHWLYMQLDGYGQWQFGYEEAGPEYYGAADTPENAAAKLAIELFKQGVLKREES